MCVGVLGLGGNLADSCGCGIYKVWSWTAAQIESPADFQGSKDGCDVGRTFDANRHTWRERSVW